MSIRIKCVIIAVLILGLLKILGLINIPSSRKSHESAYFNSNLFFLGFVFIILVIFSLTMSLSRNSERVRKMAQEIALNSYANNKKNGSDMD